MNIICDQCGGAVVKAVQAACDNAYAAGKMEKTIDPNVVDIVCCALVNIALIVAATIIIWQIAKLIVGGIRSRIDRKREKEDRRFKLMNDYQAKLLDHKKKELDNCEKNHDGSAKAAYVAYLEQCINELKGK